MTTSGSKRYGVSITRTVAALIDEHLATDMSVEQGGILVGDVDEDGRVVGIDASIQAVEAVERPAALTFTHETWDHVNAVLGQDHPDGKIVGWYHSHPNLGIHLSEQDEFIHTHFFPMPWHIAYVVDPVLELRAFFGWDHGRLATLPTALVRLVDA